MLGQCRNMLRPLWLQPAHLVCFIGLVMSISFRTAEAESLLSCDYHFCCSSDKDKYSLVAFTTRRLGLGPPRNVCAAMCAALREPRSYAIDVKQADCKAII